MGDAADLHCPGRVALVLRLLAEARMFCPCVFGAVRDEQLGDRRRKARRRCRVRVVDLGLHPVEAGPGHQTLGVLDDLHGDHSAAARRPPATAPSSMTMAADRPD